MCYLLTGSAQYSKRSRFMVQLAWIDLLPIYTSRTTIHLESQYVYNHNTFITTIRLYLIYTPIRLYPRQLFHPTSLAFRLLPRLTPTTTQFHPATFRCPAQIAQLLHLCHSALEFHLDQFLTFALVTTLLWPNPSKPPTILHLHRRQFSICIALLQPSPHCLCLSLTASPCSLPCSFRRISLRQQWSLRLLGEHLRIAPPHILVWGMIFSLCLFVLLSSPYFVYGGCGVWYRPHCFIFTACDCEVAEFVQIHSGSSTSPLRFILLLLPVASLIQ